MDQQLSTASQVSNYQRQSKKFVDTPEERVSCPNTQVISHDVGHCTVANI